jgi:hypothetical protein
MEQEYDAEGEAYGEFVMNWVMGGGLASDAPQAWRQEVLGEEPVPYYMNMTPEVSETTSALKWNKKGGDPTQNFLNKNLTTTTTTDRITR